MLTAIPRRGACRMERDELLAFVTPSLAMAVENASYRTNLERLVDTRTAELRQARDELAGTVDQLREAQGARQRFFGHISHEIRTPLTIITLAASDVAHRAGDTLDKRSRRNLDAVNDAAHKLVRLVDELLLLAAGQEGKLTTNPEPTDIAEMLRHIEAAWHLAVEFAGLTIATRIPDRLVANVDPVAIERVVSNLLSNAVKYTPRGGHVELELVDGDDGIRLSVFDTGPGIGEELRGRLFSRFQRAKGAAQRAPGAGLGLALSKYLVEAHGGTIDAYARGAAPGSELRVVLPRELVVRDAVQRVPIQLRLVGEVPVPPGSAAERAATYAPVGTAPRGTVLLAEDDVRLADLVARLLGEQYTVVVAHDGLTALELARERQPQLLITDIDMPGLDGMELARRFRELTGDRLAPIIILSAMLDLGTRLAGIDAGAVDYITKPFDPRELGARVGAQFRARELAVRLHRAEQVSALGILTSGLAHELRNPANAIANAIEPLVQKLPAELVRPEQPVGQLLDVIRDCAEQMRALSKQLLGVRGQAMELEVREAPLRDLVQRAVSLAQVASGIDVRIDIESVTLRCAPPLLTQALANLLENAGHAAGAGGWIEVRATTAGERLRLEVTDSGPGVPPALRDRVFEPFFTTKPDHIGTGLGLALVRDIVRRHHGSIEINDRPNGSAFVIELPGVCVPMIATNAV
jgi:signal transduction histidine kinase